MLTPTVTVGDILTAASILVAVTGLILAQRRDSNLRRKEYADKIRSAAGALPGRLERWRDLTLRFFDDIRPLVVDAEARFAKDHDVLALRDFMWQEIVRVWNVASQRVIDDRVQDIDTTLYGYDPNAQALLEEVVSRMRRIEHEIFNALLGDAQSAILDKLGSEGEDRGKFAVLTVAGVFRKLNQRCSDEMNAIMVPFRTEMLRLVAANDVDLYRRRVVILQVSKVLPQVRVPYEG